MDRSESATAGSHYGDSGPGATGVKSRRVSELAEETKEFAGRMADRGAQAYAQTKETLSNAYGKSSDALNDTYTWTMAYGRANPGRTILMAFGAGVGIAFLLANSRSSHRPPTYIESIQSAANAVSEFASELFRRR